MSLLLIRINKIAEGEVGQRLKEIVYLIKHNPPFERNPASNPLPDFHESYGKMFIVMW